MKTKSYILFLCFFAFGIAAQTITRERQKVLVDKSCIMSKDIISLANQDLSNFDGELTKYISKNYSKNFPKIEVSLTVIIQIDGATCYRRIAISDSSKLEKNQIDLLLSTVLKYPNFNKIKFNENEKIKYLIISIYGNKKGKTTAYFTPALLAKELFIDK